MAFCGRLRAAVFLDGVRMETTLQARWNVIQQLVSAQQWGEARSACLALIARHPDHAPALLQLSYIDSLSGSFRQSREFALQAFRANPTAPKVVAELIARLRTFNEAQAIEACARRLPPLREVDIRLLLSFAAQFSYLNEQERAMVFLDEARRGDPDFPPTLAARGQVLTYLGRFDEAQEDLRRCIRLAPELAQAHWLLSRLNTVTPARNQVGQINDSLRRFRPVGDNAALLEFALHKELDDLGEHSEAWHALTRACAAKRSTLRYSTDENRGLFETLLAKPVPPVSGEPPGLAPDTATPIFIVGMHRSGTTLLESLLGRHDHVQPLGELYDFTNQMRATTDHHCRGVVDATVVARANVASLPEAGRGYLAGVAWRLKGKSHFTDKLPSNFLNIGFICQALPQAKILHLVRDPMETAFSNLRELFSGANPYSYDQRELLDYYLQYRRLMSHWHRSFPGRILDVEYSALTRDPSSTLLSVLAFCGLSADSVPAGLGSGRAVATASAVQVRQAIRARDTPKWQPYAEHLQILLDGFATLR